MRRNIRTDLARESEALWQKSAAEADALEGVVATREQRGRFELSRVEVRTSAGEAALGKPIGSYVTLELDAVFRREENAFPEACTVLAELLRDFGLLGDIKQPCLVVGLGNRSITPDAIGPETVDRIMVTRHLKEHLPDDFAAFRPVSAVCAGVLGTTGIESGALVRALTEKLRPALVIAIDALASRAPDRLCRCVQLTDTGIVPGSGVGNARQALGRETLGIPVLALGVPTVVDAATLAQELAQRAGATLDSAAFGEIGSMIVTPRGIDKDVRDLGRLIGYAINLALQDDLSLADVESFLS